MDCDVAIVGGQLIDPDKNTIASADIGIRNGRISAISKERGQLSAAQSVDASGAYVTPVLVDAHVHCYEHVSPSSLHPDRIGVLQGVGAVIDAGSFGSHNAPGFREYVQQRAKTHVYGLVNISRWGVSTNPGEAEVIGFLNPTEVVRTIAKSDGWVVGVKVRASVTAVGALGILPVHLAKQAAREAGVPLMVHIGNGPPTLEEVCALLTEGDVITHCFHGKIGGTITQQGAVLPAVADAVQRGVRLDVGHGSGSFAWSTAERAAAAGLWPHSISTDLHAGCVADLPGKRSHVTLVRTMAKMLHLGMPLIEVVRAASVTPARAFRLRDLAGHLDVGQPANLSVIGLRDEPLELFDVEGQTRTVSRQIEARATVLEGTVYEAHAC